MKRFVAVVGLCSAFSAGSFVVLVAADRQLGLPLPYSIPVSFVTVSILAPALFALANALRRRRPLVLAVAPAAPRGAVAARGAGAPAQRPAARAAEGVVLLDFSKAKVARRAA